MSRLNRRNFLAALASGVAGLGVARRIGAEPVEARSGQGGPAAPKIKKYNPL
jgi:hypothetical protein